jgi:catechol 2,3-dioxygenase-like lactoylglutathione lyase family enzyme
MPSYTSAVALPCLTHIGVVVKNIDKTTEFLSSILGLGPWQYLEYSPPKDEIMAGEPFRNKVALAKLGPVTLVLIQPLEGRAIWSQFLETKGEGLFNLVFNVSNWEDMVLKLQKHGSNMIAGAIFEGRRWCYFDTKPGGIIAEFEE